MLLLLLLLLLLLQKNFSQLATTAATVRGPAAGLLRLLGDEPVTGKAFVSACSTSASTVKSATVTGFATSSLQLMAACSSFCEMSASSRANCSRRASADTRRTTARATESSWPYGDADDEKGAAVAPPRAPRPRRISFARATSARPLRPSPVTLIRACV